MAAEAGVEPITIGLMGLGVVGSGVARAIHQKEEDIRAHLGRPVRIGRILVRDRDKARQFLYAGAPITTDARELLEDPQLMVIVEVMGGEHPALEYIQTAIDAGKHVVTANKEIMAKHGPEVLTLAERQGVSVRFEASVGGGIPIIGPLLKDLLANEITGVNAIINGTTNYILTKMGQEGLDFQVALRQAQEMGAAEPDPTDDVEALDAAYKLAILTTLAFHTRIHATDVYHEGITRVAAQDFRYAAELGYAIKLLAIGRRQGNTIQARVHPAFVPLAHPLSKVDGVFNAVELQGDLVGRVMFHGPGAGNRPTTSAVVGDVLDIAQSIASGGRPAPPPHLDQTCTVQPMGEVETKYYLRLRAVDRPGVMAQITKVLGDLQVSLASVIQKETFHQNDAAEVVITTRRAREAAVQEAVRNLERLPVVAEVCNLIRVEDGNP